MSPKVETLELRHPNGFVFGVAVKYRDGWRFIPRVSGRMSSRKSFPTANACLPAWARGHLKQGASFLPPQDSNGEAA